MSKYYFNRDGSGEMCYSLAYFKELRIDMESDLILVEAEPSYGDGTYYCKLLGECGVSGEGCGVNCLDYKPRNGKNGRCRFSNSTYVQSGKIFMLTKNNKLIKKDR